MHVIRASDCTGRELVCDEQGRGSTGELSQRSMSFLRLIKTDYAADLEYLERAERKERTMETPVEQEVEALNFTDEERAEILEIIESLDSLLVDLEVDKDSEPKLDGETS